jgi:large subunit ribosomal protein L25
MAEITELQATVRDSAGKVAAQRIRRTGGVPCIIYGGGSAPEMITLNYKEVWKHVQTGSFLSTVCMLDIDGKKTRVIPRDIQFDPVRDFVEHIDFLRISKTSQVEVEVPVVILNEALSPGLKRCTAHFGCVSAGRRYPGHHRSRLHRADHRRRFHRR